MRIVSHGFSAAADGRSFVIDRDTTLSYVSATTNMAVSTDPGATIANSVTAPANGFQVQLIAARTGGTAIFGQIRVDFPLSAGEVIYLSAAAAGQIQLYFTDPA